MRTFYEFLQRVGMDAIDTLWFPVLLWTIAAVLVFLFLRVFRNLNPLYQYHLRIATFFALPIGLLSALALQYLYTTSMGASGLQGVILVIDNPIQQAQSYATQTAAFNADWLEPNFIIGMISLGILIIALAFIGRLIVSYIRLRSLYAHLPKEALTGRAELNDRQVYIAFHDHPLVPFTFGWKSPVIVLPSTIRDDEHKMNMAIEHELVHIRRGDYLLQLALSVIESIFWFHPLVRFGLKEIETYREISCDQEVLNTSDISPKSYASMLYELVPLQKGFGSFSVSMAVQPSTLKQRIEIMKYHKLRKTSLKRSLLSLVALTLIVIAPIACSDLRGPQSLSEEEVLNERLTFKSLKVTINGQFLMDAGTDAGTESISVGGLGALLVAPKNHGTFLISLRKFDQAVLAGSVSGNKATFRINQMSVELTTDSPILANTPEADLWVYHNPNMFISNAVMAFPDAGKAPLTGDDLQLSANLDLQGPAELNVKNEEDYFVVVEEMPELIGGLQGVQSKLEYPQMARRAGIEGRVTIQFIVNENGDVENPTVIRGIGAGCDEEALRVVRQAKFKPGYQRGRPVRVKYSLPVVFKLSDSDFSQSEPKEPEITFKRIQSQNGVIEFTLTDGNGNPLVGANIVSNNLERGAVTNSEGIAILRNMPGGSYSFTFSYAGLPTKSREVYIAN